MSNASAFLCMFSSVRFTCFAVDRRVKMSRGSTWSRGDGMSIRYQKISNQTIPIMRAVERVPVASNEAYDFSNRVGLRCICFHFSSEPHQGSFGSEPTPPLLRLAWFDGLYSHQPKRSAQAFFFWFGSNQTRQMYTRP